MENRTARDDFTIPQLLRSGTPMTKVSSKKHKCIILRIDPDLGHLIWESSQNHIIPIENIMELRSGSDITYYREQFQLAQEYEGRWMTIVYIMNGAYKTLHVITATPDVLGVWDAVLRRLHTIRRELMSGLGKPETRQAIWEKQCWKNADDDQEEKERLCFEEVGKLCRRLNIHSNTEELRNVFNKADSQRLGYLNFSDFRNFVKLLKARPEIDRLHKKLCYHPGGVFDFTVFEKFMMDKQDSRLTSVELRSIFDRYSTTTSEYPSTQQRVMTVEMFTSFLLSPDNSAFLDQHRNIWHDMTRPLPDYYVSSSHNTYLVGHQLVGASTIEGYVRVLLHGCRSVEVDIYDNDPITEPMIFHGKSLTSKVPLRDVCNTIVKYGFVASPYPIIISAEMHCSLLGQECVVAIIKQVFGEMLVTAPIFEQGNKVEKLPSPEQLKGRILFKTKDLDLVRHDSSREYDSGISTSTSETSSTSDSEVVFEQGKKTIDSKGDILKAGSSVLRHVRGVSKLTRSTSLAVTANQLHRQSLPVGSITGKNHTSEPQSVDLNGPLSSSPTEQSSVFSSSGRHRLFDRITTAQQSPTKAKQKMSPALLDLLVYTVGVKYRGINKKEFYKPEHMFSLSETTANKMIRATTSTPGVMPSFRNGNSVVSRDDVYAEGGNGMVDLIKHCRIHLVRVYPKATRVNSTNFEPHRYWSAGIQLVAINWQTFDLGYMINYAMFQRNGRAGYLLKPLALRGLNHAHPNEVQVMKDLMAKRTRHYFDVFVISAQQLPRLKDSLGREITDRSIPLHPFVDVYVHVPNWTTISSTGGTVTTTTKTGSAPLSSVFDASGTITPIRTHSQRTGVVRNNGFNPIWDEKLRIPFDCAGDMRDLIFVRFVVRQAGRREDDEPLGVYCASLGSLGLGYRHLPLHDTQMSQYLFSTLFVRMAITDT